MMSLRAIAWWQIIGGALLFLANVVDAFSAPRGLPAPSALYLMTSLFLAGLAITGGILLRAGSLRGIRLAILTQLLQIAWVSLPRVQFGSTLGPTVGLDWTATEVSFEIGFHGRGGLWFLSQNTQLTFPFEISINFLAVGAALFLLRIYRQRKASLGSATVAAA